MSRKILVTDRFENYFPTDKGEQAYLEFLQAPGNALGMFLGDSEEKIEKGDGYLKHKTYMRHQHGKLVMVQGGRVEGEEQPAPTLFRVGDKVVESDPTEKDPIRGTVVGVSKDGSRIKVEYIGRGLKEGEYVRQWVYASSWKLLEKVMVPTATPKISMAATNPIKKKNDAVGYAAFEYVKATIGDEATENDLDEAIAGYIASEWDCDEKTLNQFLRNIKDEFKRTGAYISLGSGGVSGVGTPKQERQLLDKLEELDRSVGEVNKMLLYNKLPMIDKDTFDAMLTGLIHRGLIVTEKDGPDTYLHVKGKEFKKQKDQDPPKDEVVSLLAKREKIKLELSKISRKDIRFPELSARLSLLDRGIDPDIHIDLDDSVSTAKLDFKFRTGTGNWEGNAVAAFKRNEEMLKNASNAYVQILGKGDPRANGVKSIVVIPGLREGKALNSEKINCSGMNALGVNSSGYIGLDAGVGEHFRRAFAAGKIEDVKQLAALVTYVHEITHSTKSPAMISEPKYEPNVPHLAMEEATTELCAQWYVKDMIKVFGLKVDPGSEAETEIDKPKFGIRKDKWGVVDVNLDTPYMAYRKFCLQFARVVHALHDGKFKNDEHFNETVAAEATRIRQINHPEGRYKDIARRLFLKYASTQQQSGRWAEQAIEKISFDLRTVMQNPVEATDIKSWIRSSINLSTSGPI